MKRTIAIALATLLSGAAMAQEVNLRTLAVEDGSGNLVVLWDEHTSGWWAGNQNTPFDGALNVYIDPKSVTTPTWVGYELTTPCVITRIRFYGKRSGDGEQRLCACLVQGANQSDFSDAVTLLDCKYFVPSNWRSTTTGWFDFPAYSLATTQTFRYLRFIQPSGGPGESSTFCGNIAELEFYGMDAASYATYIPATSKETNLRLYAIHDATGTLDILSDKTEPYGSGYEYTKAFDGNLYSFYDPKTVSGVSHYVGYALSKPMCVTRFRYASRMDNRGGAGRLKQCRIEGANASDFSDAVTLHECVNSVPDDWDVNPGWIEASPDAAGTNAYRYLRFIDPAGNQQCGDISELEFYGMDADALVAEIIANPQPPANLTAARGDFPVAGTKLRWQLQTGVTDSTVLRAFGVNGPWTAIAQLSGVNTYTDTTAPAGVLSYYRVAANFTYGGQSLSVTNETPATFRRWRLLERDPSDMTHVRSGVSIIYRGGPNYWTGNSLAESIAMPFDNAFGRYNFADIKQDSERTSIGVDFGQDACYVTFLRFYFVNDSQPTRLTGVRLAGSNAAEWYATGNFDDLTEPFVYTSAGRWYEESCDGARGPYRYLFCHNPSNNGWSCNATELQFYGWLESDVAAVAQGVTDITATCGTTPSVTLAWTPTSYGTYTIERKTDDGAWTVVASALPAATATWTDTGVVCDGTSYTYRVTTVNGATAAYSENRTVRPYLAGNGTGLHAEWWTNYVITTSGEALALVTTNATIDFADASIGGETENLRARWAGKLIAPCAGDFAFEADADGVVYLWIDKNPVLYNGVQIGTNTLTAGEHDITVKWHHKSGTGSCKLLWDGCVTHEVIPSTQLVPVPPRTIPGEWAGARSFAADAGTLFSSDIIANADGSLDVAHSGRDLSKYYVAYDFMWKPVKGDFTIVAKIDCLPIAGNWRGRKAALMVRSSLDVGAMMRAYGVKRTDNSFIILGMQKTTATAPNVDEQAKVADAPIDRYSAPASTWVRLRRRGNVFTAHYKTSQSSRWSLEYEYEDVNGEYGETTYVGLSTWGEGGGADTAVPYYLWRFSEVSLTTPRGFMMIVH